MFSLSIYVKAWFCAGDAAGAPANDLQLLKKLALYEDKEIAKVALEAFGRHLWYLSEEASALALFDRRLTTTEKAEMVLAMKKDGPPLPPKRVKLKDVSSSEFQQKQISSFLTKNSTRLLAILPRGAEFISTDPSLWDDREDFQAATAYVDSMHVCNDFAERGVALIQKYNSTLTKDEDQKQYLLQVFEAHRKKFPNSTKATVSKVGLSLRNILTIILSISIKDMFICK